MFFLKKQNKKLYIPFDEGVIGGVNTFLKNLLTYLDSVDFPYTTEVKNGSSIFFPVSTNLKDIETIKKRGGVVIQRLDGIHYPSQHGDDYIRRNALIKHIYNCYADFVVFQAEYSKKQCFYMFEEKSSSKYTLIPNGVNSSIFFPQANKKKTKITKFISTGNFRKLLMIEPLVKALDALESQGVVFEYHVIGETIAELDSLLDRKYIIKHGKQDLEYIASQLRKSDIFLHSQLNDNCPNSVLEAISSGIPVVAFNSGGINELLHFSIDTLAEVDSSELFHEEKDLKYEKIFEKIIYTIENYEKIQDKYLLNSNNYSLEEMGVAYVELFEKLIN